MKAITLRQPWASLVASNRKTIETRTWQTGYRGDLLICASARSPGYEHLPGGVALAVVRLVDCRPMTEADQEAACCAIYPRAVAWVLENVRPLTPFRVVGQQRLFDVVLPANSPNAAASFGLGLPVK